MDNPQPTTKRDERQKERQAIMEAEQKRIRNAKRMDTLKRVGIWGGIALALVLMVWGLAKMGASSANPNEPGGTTEPVTASDWKRGAENPKVTLIEYSDFQCPACASYHPVLKGLLDKYGSEMQFVYRPFPLPMHPLARAAAEAAEAAGTQGKFWEYHDKLFESQREWDRLSASEADETFIKYATNLGLDVEKFKQDMNSKEAKDAVSAGVSSGNRANANATPTFYLNGEKITNLRTYDDLEQAIKSLLEKTE